MLPDSPMSGEVIRDFRFLSVVCFAKIMVRHLMVSFGYCNDQVLRVDSVMFDISVLELKDDSSQSSRQDNLFIRKVRISLF